MTRRRWTIVGLTAAVPLVVAWLLWTPTGPRPSSGAVGRLDGCRAGPGFQSELDLGPHAALGTSLTDIVGLAILDPDGDGGRGSVYRHETWDDAGFLGPFLTDRHGNILVGPVPLVSLVENPPERQNRVYRVDTDSQEMALLAELPPARLPGGNSPFGVVGLAYDCETESLYATSLAGSTARDEAGRIFRIALPSGAVAAHFDGTDAIGVGVFRGTSGKRLYFGPARAPEVRSVPVAANGDFVGPFRTDIAFSDQTEGGRRAVRKIRFPADDLMSLHVIDFSYSLQVASERLEDVLTYRYDPTADQWTHLSTERPQ